MKTTAGTFGDYLRDVRKQRGLSQYALAQRIGVDHTYLSKIECGVNASPSGETLVRIAHVLLIPEREMFLQAGKAKQGSLRYALADIREQARQTVTHKSEYSDPQQVFEQALLTIAEQAENALQQHEDQTWGNHEDNSKHT